MNHLVDQLNQPIHITAATILPVDAIKNPAEAWKGVKMAKAVYVVFRRIEPSGKGSHNVYHEVTILHLNGEQNWGQMCAALSELGELFDTADERECKRIPHEVILDPCFS